MKPSKEITSAQLSKPGVIQFSLMANWSVRDLATWLENIELAYKRLNAFLLLDAFDYYEWVTRVCSHEARYVSIEPHEEYGIGRKSNRYLENLVSVAERKTQSLNVSQIRIASPGIAEMIGNLNPLKVIADFITAWRRENTVREENRLRHQRESAETLCQILEKLYKRAEFEWAEDSQEEFIKYTMAAAISALEGLAKDLRIESVSLMQHKESNQNQA